VARRGSEGKRTAVTGFERTVISGCRFRTNSGGLIHKARNSTSGESFEEGRCGSVSDIDVKEGDIDFRPVTNQLPSLRLNREWANDTRLGFCQDIEQVLCHESLVPQPRSVNRLALPPPRS
jgi:hypothetical protein